MSSFIVIIPARYESTRLPGKPLLEIGGLPLIQHVFEAASASQAEQVLIATDDQRIFDCASTFTESVIMTSNKHLSGTDRLAEVVEKVALPDDTVVVNVQGDELGLPPALIDQVALALIRNTDKQMATLCERIMDEQEFLNPNVVKVVFDKVNTALYFSRSSIPWQKQFNASTVSYKHIGIYAYRTGFLKEYAAMPPCVLEQSECLEQLRAIYNGNKIHVEEATESTGIEINTEADLEKARKLFN